jgi:hypothetical protein
MFSLLKLKKKKVRKDIIFRHVKGGAVPGVWRKNKVEEGESYVFFQMESVFILIVRFS